jgi:hypothetical protein
MVDVPAANVRLVEIVPTHVPTEDIVNVPLPSLIFLVPVPEILKLPPIEKLLLLTLKSIIHPVVLAVHAPAVREVILAFVLTVVVQVVPPTQVAASKVTVSPEPGTDAPVAPPDEADHMAVLEPSHVQVVVQTAKREAASATSVLKQRRSRARNNRFISDCLLKPSWEIIIQVFWQVSP